MAEEPKVPPPSDHPLPFDPSRSEYPSHRYVTSSYDFCFSLFNFLAL